jgi:SAM-dependent methyltransferase
MVNEILDLAAVSTYDFRLTANPDDELKHLFTDWVPYYRLKWAIARVLRPQRILEVGVRYGYSAAAFLNACPECTYLGIDNDSNTFGGHKGAIQWARRITAGAKADFLIADSQQLAEFPDGPFDLIHLDGQQDGAGSIADLRKALLQAKNILVDGYFWTRDNFLHISEFLYRYHEQIESCVIIPGYDGELLISPRTGIRMPGKVSASAELRDTYGDSYYLQDCGGFDEFKRDHGAELSDPRLQSLAHIAGIAPVGRAVDLGCGRGELSVYLASQGHEVLAVDYSANAIALARQAAANLQNEAGRIQFHCGDVNEAPFDGLYDLVAASDLVEHLTPPELVRLYSKVASHLSPSGIFVVHTWPNAWMYQYDYPRRRRAARQLGAYLPIEPRSRYEELMHINEQSPNVLRRQLSESFGHVVLWFAEEGLVSPFENLKRPFRKSELRSAGHLYCVASHSPVECAALLEKLEMRPLPAPAGLSLEVLQAPDQVTPGARFRARVRLANHSSLPLTSLLPNPVHLSYHCLGLNGEPVVFDGMRTRIPVAIRPGASADLSMDLEAPQTNGTYLFRLTLVQEFVRWFDMPPENLFADRAIRVQAAAG